MTSRRVIGFLLLLAAPCPAQSIRDSAGVRIVEYARRARAPKTWRVDPKPVLEIGGHTRPGSVEFSNVVGVARLSDGRVVVGNAGTYEVMTFDARGRFIESFGRRGRGVERGDRIGDQRGERGDGVVHWESCGETKKGLHAVQAFSHEAGAVLRRHRRSGSTELRRAGPSPCRRCC